MRKQWALQRNKTKLNLNITIYKIQHLTPYLLDLRIKWEKPNFKLLEENTGKSHYSLETGKDFSKIYTNFKKKKTGHLLPLKLGSFYKNSPHSVVSDSLQAHGVYSTWNSPGQNTGVGSLSLLQGIFPTQESNPGLTHCRRILYQLSHEESPEDSVVLVFSKVLR